LYHLAQLLPENPLNAGQSWEKPTGLVAGACDSIHGISKNAGGTGSWQTRQDRMHKERTAWNGR
jgi:hypothetical protein